MPIEKTPAALLVNELSLHHSMVNQAIHKLVIVNQRIVNQHDPRSYPIDLKWLSQRLNQNATNWVNNIFYDNPKLRQKINSRVPTMIEKSIMSADDFLSEIKSHDIFEMHAHAELLDKAETHQYQRITNAWLWGYITDHMQIENLLMILYRHKGHTTTHLNLNNIKRHPTPRGSIIIPPSLDIWERNPFSPKS